MTTTPDTVEITTTTASVDGAPTLLFVHGFLDDATVWDGVIASLAGKVNTVRYDLPGFGARSAAVTDPRELSLQSLAAEAGEILNETDTRVIVVGQSLGNPDRRTRRRQTRRPCRWPRPAHPCATRWHQLPDEVVAPFRASAVTSRRSAARKSTLASDRETSWSGSSNGGEGVPEVVARYVDIWNNGVPDEPVISEYTGPVLVVRGGDDGLVSKSCRHDRARFPGAGEKGHRSRRTLAPCRAAASRGACSWSSAMRSRHTRARQGSRQRFAQQSQSTFADEFADEVVLDATTLVKPIRGKQQVAQVLTTASSIYESLEFTAEANDASTTYLQWKATAFGGMQIGGITILDRDVNGKIISAAIHHRPLGAVLRFATEIRNHPAA